MSENIASTLHLVLDSYHNVSHNYNIKRNMAAL